MLRFKRQGEVPPGGWSYTIPDSGEPSIVLKTHTWNQLVTQVQLYRTANGGDLTAGWVERLEGEVCTQKKLGSRWCEFSGEGQSFPERVLTIHDMRVFLAVAKSWLLTGREFVSQEEANRRAEICSMCPHNVPVGGCKSCGDLVNAAMAVVGGRQTPFDSQLKACRICGCELKSMCHLPLKTLARGLSGDHHYPESYCWKAKIADYR